MKERVSDGWIWLFFFSVLVAAGLTVKAVWWLLLGWAVP